MRLFIVALLFAISYAQTVLPRMAQIGDGGTECPMEKVILNAADCEAAADRLGMRFHKHGSWPVQFGCVTDLAETTVWFNTRTGATPRTHRKPICTAPADCVMSGWSNTGSCSATCGQGIQTQTRTVLSEAAHGGEACPTDLIREISCNVSICHPVDCVVSDWSNSGSCSTTCGEGRQTQTRTVHTEAAHGGA